MTRFRSPDRMAQAVTVSRYGAARVTVTPKCLPATKEPYRCEPRSGQPPSVQRYGSFRVSGGWPRNGSTRPAQPRRS